MHGASAGAPRALAGATSASAAAVEYIGRGGMRLASRSCARLWTANLLFVLTRTYKAGSYNQIFTC